jgi:hypothetical protein
MAPKNTLGLPGKRISSKNGDFVVANYHPFSQDKLGKIVLTQRNRSKPNYIKSFADPRFLAVSNNGLLVVVNVDCLEDGLLNQILIFDDLGAILFEKQSKCTISAAAISGDGTFVAIAFAGEKRYLESYLVLIIDVKKSSISQIKPVPNNISVVGLEFDNQNSLRVNGIS